MVALSERACCAYACRVMRATQHQIEEEVAKFMGTEEAISYSDSATTISSAIAAFAKKGDLTIVDQVYLVR